MAFAKAEKPFQILELGPHLRCPIQFGEDLQLLSAPHGREQ